MTITRIPKKDKDLILFLKNFIATLEPHLALLDVPAAEFETLKTMTTNRKPRSIMRSARALDIATYALPPWPCPSSKHKALPATFAEHVKLKQNIKPG